MRESLIYCVSAALAASEAEILNWFYNFDIDVSSPGVSLTGSGSPACAASSTRQWTLSSRRPWMAAPAQPEAGSQRAREPR